MAGNEHDNNRSSALSPEQMAIINTTTANAVQEAIGALMKGLLPAFKEMAFTPEKFREATRVDADPKILARILREERESLKSKQDEAEIARITAARRAACPHVDKNGRSSINLCHNQPDHQPRGVCVVCHDWIHPREWRIGVVDDKNPRGKAYLVEAHKDYRIVLQLESTA